MRGVVAGIVLVVVALSGASCARKAPPVAPGPDKFPEFAFPAVPPELQRTAATLVRNHDLAWRSLQGGDPRAAERGFSTVLKQQSAFFPAEAGLGYVELARGNENRAVEHFDRALARAPQYLPALLGRGQALLRGGRTQEALEAFEAALVVDPSLVDVRRRVEALRFQGVEDALADARVAEAGGRLEEALAAYEKAAAASPESAFLYRDRARVERGLGRTEDAIAHARRAIELDPTDGASYLMLAELLESRQQWDEAIAAMERARDLDAAPDLAARLESLRDRAALSRLPEEYRAIPGAERISRGQLAALFGVRFEPLLRDVRAGRGVLVTDIRQHWAQPWILAVARARVIEPFDNHTFQPGAVVRRGDLARAVSGVLTLIAQRNPQLGKTWTAARRTFPDLGAGNLYYPAASLAVTAGILDTTPDGSFQAGRIVSGAEAVDAVERLERLAAKAGVRRGP
jgi:tetratricopeptide (TPR) repeat protein